MCCVLYTMKTRRIVKESSHFYDRAGFGGRYDIDFAGALSAIPYFYTGLLRIRRFGRTWQPSAGHPPPGRSKRDGRPSTEQCAKRAPKPPPEVGESSPRGSPVKRRRVALRLSRGEGDTVCRKRVSIGTPFVDEVWKGYFDQPCHVRFGWERSSVHFTKNKKYDLLKFRPCGTSKNEPEGM